MSQRPVPDMSSQLLCCVQNASIRALSGTIDGCHPRPRKYALTRQFAKQC